MRAMIVKEFRQLRRDRRTLAMMIVMPILLLVILGYAASFDVSVVPTVVAGPGAGTVAQALPKTFELASTYPAGGAAWDRDGTAGPHRRQPAVHRAEGPAGARGHHRRRPGRRGGHHRPHRRTRPRADPVQPPAEDVGHHDPRPGGRHPGVRRDRDH